MPPSMTCQHRGEVVPYEQSHNAIVRFVCDLCGKEFTRLD
jgi:transposase-like protein